MASGNFNITRTSGSSYLTFRVNWSSVVNRDGNYSTVTVSVYVLKSSTSSSATYGTANTTVNVGGTSKSENGLSFSVNPGGTTLLFSKGGYRVNHNNDGSKTVNIAVSVGGDVMSASGNANVTLDKIQRQATITNSPASFTDEENPWFTFTNPANATMSCWLEINPNGEHLAERTPTGTSGTYTWDLTNEERNQLRAKIPNSNTATCRIGLYSTIGSATYASFHDRTFRIVNANPTFEDFDYEDINSTTVALTGNNQKIIKGYSNLQATISTNNKAIPLKYATMSYYQLLNTKENYSDEEDVIITSNNYDLSNVMIQAVDSRGNSTSVTKDITNNLIEYNPLTKGTITLERSNNGVGENVTLTYNGTFWNDSFGNSNNSLSASYKFKKSSDSTYTVGTTTINPTINNNNFSFSGLIAGDTQTYGFDIDESYEFEITVQDLLTTIIYTGIIGAGTPAIAIYKNKASLGAKYDENLGGTQLWGDVYLNGNTIGTTDIFSTTEIKTNKKWTNNKPIYRKVIVGTNLSTAGSLNTGISNVDEWTDFWFRYTYSNGDTYIGNYYQSSTSYVRNFLSTADTIIRLRSGQSPSVGKFIVEYTKTTD